MSTIKTRVFSSFLILTTLLTTTLGLAAGRPDLSQLSDSAVRTLTELEQRYPYSVLTREVPLPNGTSAVQTVILVGADEAPFIQNNLPMMEMYGERSWGSFIVKYGSAVMSVFSIWTTASLVPDLAAFARRIPYATPQVINNIYGLPFFMGTSALSLLIADSFANRYFELSNPLFLFMYPRAYYTNWSRVSDASSKIVDQMKEIPGKTEVVMYTQARLYKRVQTKLVEYYNYRSLLDHTPTYRNGFAY